MCTVSPMSSIMTCQNSQKTMSTVSVEQDAQATWGSPFPSHHMLTGIRSEKLNSSPVNVSNLQSSKVSSLNARHRAWITIALVTAENRMAATKDEAAFVATTGPLAKDRVSTTADQALSTKATGVVTTVLATRNETVVDVTTVQGVRAHLDKQ